MTDLTLEQQLEAGIQQHADSAALFQAHATTLQSAIQITGNDGSDGEPGLDGGNTVSGLQPDARPLILCLVKNTASALSNANGEEILQLLCGHAQVVQSSPLDYIIPPRLSFAGVSRWGYQSGILNQYEYNQNGDVVVLTGLFIINSSDTAITSTFNYNYSASALYTLPRRLFVARKPTTGGVTVGLQHEATASGSTSSNITVAPGERVALLSIGGAVNRSSSAYVYQSIDGLDSALGNGISVDLAATIRAHQLPISNLADIWEAE